MSALYPGQNAAVLCKKKIIVIASSVAALGWLKKEEKEENPSFDPCSLAALESFALMLFLFLIINLFSKCCHACMKLQD